MDERIYDPDEETEELDELVYDAPDGIMDMPEMSTGENRLTQLDPYCQHLLEQNLWDYQKQQNGKKVILVRGRWGHLITYGVDGTKTLTPHFYENSCKYPDILNAYAWAASHLNKNLNLPQHLAYWLIMEWEGKFMDSLELKYEDEHVIITLLDAIDSVLKRNLIESIDGSGQKYNISMAGGHRIVEQRIKQENI